MEMLDILVSLMALIALEVLALSFLMVIGVSLVAESMGHHLPKGYIYGPMAFAFIVDVVQMRVLGSKKA